MVIKTAYKNSHTNQWNRIEIKPHINGQLIFDKGAKNIQWRKESLFNKWFWENWTAKCNGMKEENYLTPYTILTQNGLKT